MFQLFKKKVQGQQVVFKIKGMHCNSCALSIDGALEDTNGVLSSETNFAKSETKIRFDNTKVAPEELVQLIKDTGYSVENVQE